MERVFPVSVWIDTHCHLDTAEFGAMAADVRQRARAAGVVHCVIPAVEVGNFGAVRSLAHAGGDSYALGIHPLFVPRATDADLQTLELELAARIDDPRLVAVGEIGLDFFVPALCEPAMRERQEYFYMQQLRLARSFDLPVILHVRRSADRLLRGLRQVGGERPAQLARYRPRVFRQRQQARAFTDLGLKLGFGGAVTYERALRLRRLATDLPLCDLVLETDAPDIPPHWLYTTAAQRANGETQLPNEPAQLPAIGAEVARLRGMTVRTGRRDAVKMPASRCRSCVPCWYNAPWP